MSTFSGDTYTGLKATVVGWGVTSFPMGDPSPVLQKLEVETLSNFQCSRLIEEPVSLGMVCASATHKQGTCFVSLFKRYYTVFLLFILVYILYKK